MLDIIIIGGGFSGSMVACNLLRQASASKTHIKIGLVEKRPHFSQGAAYSTQNPAHLLNVPVHNMSAYADQPDHLHKWLHGKHVDILGEVVDGKDCADRFIPRALYGTYLADTLRIAQNDASTQAAFTKYNDTATDIVKEGDEFVVQLQSGDVLKAQKIVLALGNQTPSHPWVKDNSFYNSSSYIGNPWTPTALNQIKTDDPVLIIGTGLTMIDTIMALHAQNHKGQIYAVSRHGLLSQSHAPYKKTPVYDVRANMPKTVLGMFKLFKAALKTSDNWRNAVDGIRPLTQKIWQGFSIDEKQKFARHLRTYWDIHRHRVAIDVHNIVTDMSDSGQLQIMAARIKGYEQKEDNSVSVNIRPRHKAEHQKIDVRHVVNCTGASHAIAKSKDVLLQNLLSHGIITAHSCGAGIAVKDNGQVIGTNADPIYTLGTLKIGELWETTAVPELRVQAYDMAKTLLQ